LKTLLITGLLCGTLLALTGCGQRGSLYFAEPEAPADTAPATSQDDTDDDSPAR